MHPAVFPEAELIEELRGIRREFYGSELTDEQIGGMLSGTVRAP